MNLSNEEKEFIRRVDYRFNLNDMKVQEIFDTITSVIYTEFNNNPSYENSYLNLNKILDNNYDDFVIENKIRLNVLKSRYNLSKKDIIDSIRKIMMSRDIDTDKKAILQYLMYLNIKCKSFINYEFVFDKLSKDLETLLANIKEEKNLKYVDNTLSVAKVGLPNVSVIIKKDSNEPNVIK